MSNKTLPEIPMSYLDQLLHRAIVDSEFRIELLSRPEEFGITKADVENLALLTSVEQQDMSFVELVVEDDMVRAACGRTCVSGFTILCDGSTQPNCRRTCVSGYTIRCDGVTV
ncbi:hypothetical protein Cylst_1653 [Cylindrospermum stagnale PCC 7417]|uniref:Nif11 domain-containing protein n=1 Tax=Cylindrospermum stagnale PCC 7417 TaxID=56107 RepID=K9WUN8_9NOST|nr:cinnamycin family lantibiotic [Cylindrospermum stagnale]AFZ23928.1 hypothetical protein Cylst_1653 [Cylindrospermum stagnale PCC 7417]